SARREAATAAALASEEVVAKVAILAIFTPSVAVEADVKLKDFSEIMSLPDTAAAPAVPEGPAGPAAEATVGLSPEITFRFLSASDLSPVSRFTPLKVAPFAASLI